MELVEHIAKCIAQDSKMPTPTAENRQQEMIHRVHANIGLTLCYPKDSRTTNEARLDAMEDLQTIMKIIKQHMGCVLSPLSRDVPVIEVEKFVDSGRREV